MDFDAGNLILVREDHRDAGGEALPGILKAARQGYDFATTE
jgi:hypothetical protein